MNYNDIWVLFPAPVEHVRVDSGLPSAVRLVRIRPVPRGSALRQKHAAGGESGLRQPVYCTVPEAVGHRHRRGFYLRRQRVSPESDGCLQLFIASNEISVDPTEEQLLLVQHKDGSQRFRYIYS